MFPELPSIPSHNTGNIAVVNGITGDLKFFQERGYTTRNEDLAHLLRGQHYAAKKQDYDKDVKSGSYNPYVLLYEGKPLTKENKQVIKTFDAQSRTAVLPIEKGRYIMGTKFAKASGDYELKWEEI